MKFTQATHEKQNPDYIVTPLSSIVKDQIQAVVESRENNEQKFMSLCFSVPAILCQCEEVYLF